MRRAAAALAAGVLVAASLGGPAAASPQSSGPGIHSADGRLLDGQGRNVVLRGVNLTEQNPAKPELGRWLRQENFDRIAALGFNHVRLNTFWQLIQPDGPDSYDAGYLRRLRELFNMAGKSGLLVVLDFHQDQYSTAVGGRGAPEWAAPQCNTGELPPELATVVDPLLGDIPAGGLIRNVLPDLQIAYLNFWEDGFGAADHFCTGPVQTHFHSMLQRVVAEVGDHPSLVGYDLLNEPFPTGGPGVFETRYLYPFYDRAAAAIRAAEARHGFDDRPLLFGFHLLSVFGNVPVKSPDPNAVYAPHLYTEEFFTQGAVTDWGIDDTLLTDRFLAEAGVLGVPTWFGEWGDTHTNKAGLDYVRTVYRIFDARGLGATYWEYAKLRETAATNPPFDVWSPHYRIYPEAYPGPKRGWTYTANTGTFQMTVQGSGITRLPVAEQLGEPKWTVSAGTAHFDPVNRRLCWTLPAGTTQATIKISTGAGTTAPRGPACS